MGIRAISSQNQKVMNFLFSFVPLSLLVSLMISLQILSLTIWCGFETASKVSFLEMEDDRCFRKVISFNIEPQKGEEKRFH